jgi:cell division protein FtsB
VQTVDSTSTSQTVSGSVKGRRSRRSRSSYRYEAKLRRYRYFLIGICVIFLLTYVYTWLYIAKQSAQAEQVLLEFRQQEKQLSSMRAELAATTTERDALVQERIPGLIPIQYDQTITPDNEFIRNIIFTMVKTGQKETYEYRLVMQNDSLSVVRPMVEILIFNDVGIQIGMAEVQHKDASTTTGRPALDPGEVRSYTAAINLIRDEEPYYFLLAVSQANQASAEKLREHLGDVISP